VIQNSDAEKRVYLDDGRASQDVVVRDGLVAGSQNDVALASNAHGDSDSVGAAAAGGNRSPDGTRHGDEGSVNGSIGLVGRADLEGDCRTGGDRASRHQGQGGESFHGQGRVAGRARRDEGRRNGVDLIEVERVIERLSGGSLAEGRTQVGAVARLDREDATGGSQIGLVGDGGSGSEVGTDTNT
jgi:hypothetical protein